MFQGRSAKVKVILRAFKRDHETRWPSDRPMVRGSHTKCFTMRYNFDHQVELQEALTRYLSTHEI